MQIDPSIALNVRPPQIENPANALAKVLQVRGLQQQNALGQMQMEEHQRGIAERNALAGIVSNPSYQKGGRFDVESAIPELYRAAPSAAGGFVKSYYDQQKAGADAAKTRAQAGQEEWKLLASLTNLAIADPRPQTVEGLLAQWESATGRSAEATRRAFSQLQTGEQIREFALRMNLEAKDQLYKFETRNTGGQTQTLRMDPVRGSAEVANATQNTATPGDLLQDSRGRAQLAESSRHNRAMEGYRGQEVGGKAPSGYRYKPDASGLEAIPGGPADIKAGELGEKARARAQHAVGQAGVVIDAIDEALNKSGFFETGLTGSVVGRVPGTDAYDVRRTVETVKANIGFDNLQRMRDMSPTGGALGQVAVQELNALQATIANLDANQSEAVLRRNLEKARRHYTNWRTAIAQSAGIPLEQPAAPPAAPGALGSGSFGITSDAIAAELARRRGGR